MRAMGEYTATDPRMISFSAGELMVKEKEEGGCATADRALSDVALLPLPPLLPLLPLPLLLLCRCSFDASATLESMCNA